MPVDRYFSPQDFIPGQQLSLEDQEFHHLAHVARVQPGEEVTLVNGRGMLAKATVQALKKKLALLAVEAVEHEPPAEEEVVLAQAIPRMHRLDFILEKGTELGMTQFWLFPGAESERKSVTEHQLERMRTITIAAMKQCGRLYLPNITVMPRLAQWEMPPWPAYFGDVASTAPAFLEVWKGEPEQGIIFYIGPESGFTSEEELMLERLKAKGVKLHPNILRTDTAALTALSLIAQGQMIKTC